MSIAALLCRSLPRASFRRAGLVLSSLFLAVSPGLARGYDTFRLNFERLGIMSGTLLILMIFYFLSPLFGAALLRLFGLLTGVAA